MEDLEELVVAAQQGNRDAFGRIVDRFQNVAYFIALRYRDNQQQAQDAAEDAFIDAYRCLLTLAEPRACPTWFRRPAGHPPPGDPPLLSGWPFLQPRCYPPQLTCFYGEEAAVYSPPVNEGEN